MTSTTSTLDASGGPSCQQRGQITFYPRTILRSPGQPRVYLPGTVPPGTKVRFARSNRIYEVAAGGNLVRCKP